MRLCLTSSLEDFFLPWIFTAVHSPACFRLTACS
jgi:hypothetical protein